MNNENVFGKYLPLGTVVLLKDASKKVSIIGYKAYEQNDNEKEEYDYVGCLYPEGVISSDKNLLFNHNQIQKVCYIGYNDDEYKKVNEFLNKIEV